MLSARTDDRGVGGDCGFGKEVWAPLTRGGQLQLGFL